MSTLLQLPREIRDEILRILLDEPLHEPAPTPSRVQKWNNRRDPNDSSARKIRYPSLQPSLFALNALLFVNRQLHHECRDAASHLEKCGKPSLTFDLLIEDNRWLFPTALQVPSFSPVLRMVQIQIRPYLTTGSTALGGFAATWRFGGFINAFLSQGPALNFSKKCKTFVIEELVIDLVTDNSLRNPGCSSDQLMDHVKQLRSFMEKQMDGFLLVRDKKYFIPWGPILLSRVRRLKIVEVGETVLEIDVAERARECGVKLVKPLEMA